MKKIIYFLGIVFLSSIIILNLKYTAFLDNSEHIIFYNNSWLFNLGIVLVVIVINYIVSIINKKLNKKERSIQKKIVIIALLIYLLVNILWVIFVNPKVVGDSVHVCNLAQIFYKNDYSEMLFNSTYIDVTLYEYMQAYIHQIPLAFIFSIIFRLIHFDIMEVLRIINIISNIAIVIGLYKIQLKLSSKYNTNTTLLFILILTFFTLPLLNTFIYGDIPSLALCIFAIYFIMCFTESHKMKYFIYTIFCTMLAYMMRMNSLIFIIGIIIYMLLNLFSEWNQNNLKNNLKSISLIFIFMITSIVPAVIIINYYSNKYNLDNTKNYPTISYILMAMEESPRGNGWYNEEIAKEALLNPDKARDEYPKHIYNRISYFLENPSYTFEFYAKKVASMWTENTYSAIQNNIRSDSDYIKKLVKPIEFYQKALLVLICSSSLIVLIQNRKKLSLEIILLLTAFVGGFAFHILWEAKSRYIIPYIIILIPIASIHINLRKQK